jgi:hypothetical protein
MNPYGQSRLSQHQEGFVSAAGCSVAAGVVSGVSARYYSMLSYNNISDLCSTAHIWLSNLPCILVIAG